VAVEQGYQWGNGRVGWLGDPVVDGCEGFGLFLCYRTHRWVTTAVIVLCCCHVPLHQLSFPLLPLLYKLILLPLCLYLHQHFLFLNLVPQQTLLKLSHPLILVEAGALLDVPGG